MTTKTIQLHKNIKAYIAFRFATMTVDEFNELSYASGSLTVLDEAFEKYGMPTASAREDFAGYCSIKSDEFFYTHGLHEMNGKEFCEELNDFYNLSDVNKFSDIIEDFKGTMAIDEWMQYTITILSNRIKELKLPEDVDAIKDISEFIDKLQLLQLV